MQALANKWQCTPLAGTSLLFAAHHISGSASALMGVVDRRPNSVTSDAAAIVLKSRKAILAKRVVGQLYSLAEVLHLKFLA